MAKLLSIISLILAIALFPPAVLAVVSNNAVPGDTTYPIKRGLEDMIYAIASLNPNIKAWFASARSDRRFQEIAVLTAQGKVASQTLNELVEQTQTAANQINQVSDPAQREQLINQLSDSITKYEHGLSQISQQAGQSSVPTPEQSSSTLLPSVSTPPSSANTTRPIAFVQPSAVQRSSTMPQFAATPQPTASSPQPVLTPQASPYTQPIAPGISPLPSSSIVPLPSPSPVPPAGPSGNGDIDRARAQLERIKEELEQREKQNQNLRENKANQKEQDNSDKQEKRGQQEKAVRDRGND